jgi:hypothetical protein
MRVPRSLMISILIITATAIRVFPMRAQSDSTEQQNVPCDSPEFRQFDFWIGEWDVQNQQGKAAGTSFITPVLNGCAIHEEWHSAGSTFAGNSYNAFDRARNVWHQTWVDNSGLLLQLEGEFKDGKMVLVGERPGSDGGTVINRIAWEALAPDSVRQVWDVSSDGGATWTVQFDGLYVRRGR